MRTSRHLGLTALLALGLAPVGACGIDLAGTGLGALPDPDGDDGGFGPAGNPGGPGRPAGQDASPGPDAAAPELDGSVPPGPEGGVDAGPPACPAKGGPAMVRLPAGFCVDSTEVTNAQYAVFLDAVLELKVVPNQPVQCVTNTNFRPGRWNGQAPYFNASRTAEPVDSIDWCDATAFCAWAGKRLCGKRGGGERPLQNTNADPAVSEFFYACSGNGATAYPYGNTYVPTSCNGRDTRDTQVANVGAHAACNGGFPGLYDLSGNVWEWENACQENNCVVRGGSFGEERGEDLACAAVRLTNRNDTNDRIGVRCCAD